MLYYLCRSPKSSIQVAIIHVSCSVSLYGSQQNKFQINHYYGIKKNSVAWVCEQLPLVGEARANFCGSGCHMVSTTNSYGCILRFLDQSCYFLFQVTPQLHSWGWVDPVQDPLLLRKYGSARNRTWTFGSVASNSLH
jgi:hypothetical protein